MRDYLRQEYRRSSALTRQTKAVFRTIVRTGRLALLAGIPLRKELLVIRGASHDVGLFAAFATVLGLLEHYDNWRGLYAGIKVDFADRGLYYDPSVGENWWEYYFEPLDHGTSRNTPRAIVSDDEQFRFAKRVERTMPRQRGFRLIDRYIRTRQPISREVDTYVRANFGGVFMVGIHYRGTDKSEDAPRVPYERVRATVLDLIKAARRNQYKLFIATDEQGFLDYMLEQFPGRVRYLEMYRSVDGRPIDIIQGDNRKKGEDAVKDCLLLSRCDCLVRTASNLSLCSTLFNPDMPVTLLNRER